MKPRNITLLVILLMGTAGTARAEKSEMAAGLQGGLTLPGFSPTSSTAFTCATWSVGAFYQYGLLDDLFLLGSFTFETFEGDASGYTFRDTGTGLVYQGTLRSTVNVYHLEVGAKYKLFSGYSVAPYLDAKMGFFWSTFGSPGLRDQSGALYNLNIGDFGEGAFTLSVGLSFDYRLLNLFFIGFGINFTKAFGGATLGYQFTTPLQISYYW